MKKHITHGFHLVKGRSGHAMEDYLVAQFKQVDDNELGLFAIFDGHSGHSVPDYLKSHLFDNILKEVMRVPNLVWLLNLYVSWVDVKPKNYTGPQSLIEKVTMSVQVEWIWLLCFRNLNRIEMEYFCLLWEVSETLAFTRIMVSCVEWRLMIYAANLT